jgi:hypothetical protein
MTDPTPLEPLEQWSSQAVVYVEHAYSEDQSFFTQTHFHN